MHGDDARLPVEHRGLDAIGTAALDAHEQRLQAFVGDETAALDLALAAHDQGSEPARFADGGDAITLALVLEAVDGVADEEAARAPEHLVGEVDARRQCLWLRYCAGHDLGAGFGRFSGGGGVRLRNRRGLVTW